MIGRIIENYEIVEVLGKGGMGIVYKAIETDLERTVALKTLDPVYAEDENFLRRFRKEAISSAQSQHPNIVTIYRLLKTDEGIYIIMEFVDGETLADRIHKSGPIPWQKSLPIFKQVLRAIGKAHQSNVVHRDIKPRNIMIRKDGAVKVTDFGLAKVKRSHGQESTVTSSGAGTLYYMSPEQVKSLRDVDHRSDVYSLGMTLYEMLAGRPPFEKNETDFSIQKKIVEGKITSLSQINPSIPKKLTRIVTKAIKKKPDDRYKSTDAMLKAIEQFEESEAEKQKPMAKRPIRLNRWAAGTILVLLFCILMIVTKFPFNLFNGEKNQITENLNQLSSEKTELSILTKPKGTSIFINNDSIGITPLINYEIETGSINLQLKKNKFINIDTSLTLKVGDPYSFSFILDAISEDETMTETQDKEFKDIPPTIGGISITTQPSDAMLWLDEKQLGTTPYRNYEIQLGEHKLRLILEGYKDFESDIIIRGGEIYAKNFTMEKTTGILNLDSKPAGAKVWLDDQQLIDIVTPCVLDTIKVGTHKIVFKMEGYDEYSTEVSVKGGVEEKVEAILNSLLGSLNIMVIPYGTITIDGKIHQIDASTRQIISLSMGKHTVQISNPAFGIWEETVEMVQNQQQNLLINFNKLVTLTFTSEPIIGCEIIIDNKSTGKYTPSQLQLRVGKHTIDIQKEGYEVLGGHNIINISEDEYRNMGDGSKNHFSVPINFKMKTKQ